MTPNLTTRILFFTGKGGVGKTSLACATAVSLASAGKQVLLVSTDPASNLDEVLGVHLSNAPTAVPGAEGLFALNIDPEAAARAYRERVIGPYRDLLPAAAVASMEEQLSGACTVEIAAFDEFTKLLGDTQATSGYDHIIFDTAPTGHTLRLLHLPAAWTGFMANNTTGTSCLGPLSGLETQKSLYDASLHALTDPATTTLILVSRPSRAALAEASRTSLELLQMGVRNQRLYLNGVFTAQLPADHGTYDPAAQALEARGREALASMPPALAALPRTEVALLSYAPMGLANLAHVFSPIPALPEAFAVEPAHPSDQSLAALIDNLERQGNGVIMTMGKGGVGKTTLAAAIAVELAHRGHKVHLSTTDPAAHVAATLAGDGDSNSAGLVPNLTVSRIDPAAETRDYSQAVITKASPQLDAAAIALLEEDLRSPCTEEIAVFTAFARTVEEGERGFVVLDTAPTGHTILLLDAAEAYHREVTRTLSDQPDSVRNLLPRLRNPNFTRVLLVTLPEATPVHEAAHLQADLARAGITPYAWIVNQTFTGQRFTDPTLINRGRREQPFITEVRDKFATRMATVPWQPFEPTGPDRLRQIAHA